MKTFSYFLLCFLALGLGCMSERHHRMTLRPDVHYTTGISNGLVADIVRRSNGTIDILFLRDDRPVAQLGSDGHLIFFDQGLRSSDAAGLTNEEATGFSGIHVWTRDGKLIRHNFEWFDGRTQQYIYDRNNDFFPDSRRTYDSVSKTNLREVIQYEFVPSKGKKPDHE